MHALTRLSVLFFILLLLGGCSQKVVRTFEYHSPVADVVWPIPPSMPRYRLVGELYGESNFKQKKQGRSFLQILVGFFVGKPRPNVLQRPQSGYTDEQGRVYVTDVSRQAVLLFDIPNNSLHVFSWLRSGLPIRSPIAVSAAPQGDIYVSDAEQGVVARLHSDGTPVSVIGNNILKRPTGIAYDPLSKQLFVADTKDHNVKVFDELGHLIQVIGSRGEGSGEFNYPTHLAYRAGRLYVTDRMNSRIQILDVSGEFVSSFGDRGRFVGDIPHPKGVAADSDGNIYVLESYFDHLLIYNATGELLLPIGGTGKGIGEFYLPAGVWVDNRDRVYIADMFNGRIVILQYLGES